MAISGKSVGSATFDITSVFDSSALLKGVKGAKKSVDQLTKSLTENIKLQEEANKEMKRAEHQARGYSETISRADRLQKSFFERYKRGFAKGKALSVARQENGFYQLANAIGVAATAFNKVESDAVRTFKRFQGLQRVGINVQATLGVLSGTIGDLSGVLMSFVGVLGAAAGSAYALAGGLGMFLAAGITAKFALNGVGQAVSQLWKGQTQYNKALADSKKQFRDLKFEAEQLALNEQDAAIQLEKARETLARVQDLPPDNRTRREAELAFQQAELNYRKIKAQIKDNEAAIKRGSKGLMGATADPMANLTESQKSFVRYLVSLKSTIQELKEVAANSFLPPLQKGIETIVKNVFPSLQVGLKAMGKDMGTAFQTIATGLSTPKNLQNIENFFIDAGKNALVFGEVVSAGLGAFLSMMHAVQPITERFGKWLTKYFGNLDEYFSSRAFTEFLQLAGDVASKLGSVFGSVFDGISNIIHAAFPSGADSGAGGVLLEWLQKITDGFKAFTGSNDFAEWLKGATENGTTALSTIGKFLHIFLDLAARPETKQFWEILAQAVDPVRAMLEAGLKAGPSFAKMLVSIANLMAVFATDTGMLTSFFDTLTLINDILTAILTPLKPLIEAFGKIHGVFLALGLVIKVSVFFFKSLSGMFETIFNQLGGIFERMGLVSKSTQDAAKETGYYQVALGKLKKAYQPVLWGFKAGLSGQLAFVKSMIASGKAAREQAKTLKAAGDATVSFGTKVRTAFGNVASKAIDSVTKKLLPVVNMTEKAGGNIFKAMSKGADQVRLRTVMLANAVDRTSDRMIKAFTRANKKSFKIPSRRSANRAMMADAGSTNMDGISDEQRMAPLAATEQASAAARVTIRQRLMKTLKGLEAGAAKVINAGQVQLIKTMNAVETTRRNINIASRARNAKIYAAGYDDSMGWLAKQKIGFQVFRKSQLAADIQFYARRAKFNVINPTWLTGPIKSAAKTAAAFMESAPKNIAFQLRQMKANRDWAVATRRQEMIQVRKNAAERRAHSFREFKENVKWHGIFFKEDMKALKDRVLSQNIFDTKRRASLLEQIKFSTINNLEAAKQSKAVLSVGKAVDVTKKKFAALSNFVKTRGPLGRLADATATLAGPVALPKTSRRIRNREQMATMAAGNMPMTTVSNPTPVIAGAKPGPPAAGLVKTLAQQKAAESNYTNWWSQKLTLRARIKRQLDIRGMSEEGKSLGVRLTNVARAYTLEAAAVGAVKRKQLTQRMLEISQMTAAEVSSSLFVAKNKIAADTQHFLYRSKHNILSFGRSVVQYKKDAIEFAKSTAYKTKYNAIYLAGAARRGLVNFKQNFATYRKDAVEFVKSTAHKARYNAVYLAGVARRNFASYRKDAAAFMATVKEKASFELKQLRYNARYKWAELKQASGATAMWGRIKNASLDAAKQARYSWAASNGATEQDLKDLEVRLQSIKTKAELKGDSLVAGMTPGFGGFRGTMGRMSAQYGGAAMGIGTAVSMLGPQAESPSGLTQGLGAAGMAAMMIPGGQLAGVGLMVAGAISSGFDKAAEDERKRLEKIKEIRIAKATVINESVERAKTGIAALVGQGVEVGTATRRYNAQLDKAKELSGVDTMVKGADESKEDFEARKKTASESASRAVDLFTESGLFKGEKGSNKAIGMMDRFKSLTEPGNAMFGNNPEALAEQLIKIQREGFEGKDGKMLKGEKAFDAFYKASGAANENAGFVPNKDGKGAITYETKAGGRVNEAESKILGLFNEESIVNKGVHKDSMFATQESFSKYATSTLKKEGIATPSVVLPTAGGMGKDTDYINNQVAPAYKAARDKIINELNAKADLPENMRYAYDKETGKIMVETLQGQEVEKKKRDLESQTIYQGIWDSTKEMVAAYREKKDEGITLKIVDKDGKPIDVQALANG
jgi:hypothetical protein